MLTPIDIGLIVLVCVAAWSDLRTRHIPNSITVSGAVVALLLHAFYGGIGGAMQSLTGDSVFALTERVDQPIVVFDGGSEEPRFLIVPPIVVDVAP